MPELPATAAAADGEVPVWSQLSPAAVCARLKTAPSGLTAAEAARRSAEHGANVLAAEGGTGPFALLLAQLKRPLVYLLLAAAVLTWAMGHTIDTWVILTVVGVNALWDFSRSTAPIRLCGRSPG